MTCYNSLLPGWEYHSLWGYYWALVMIALMTSDKDLVTTFLPVKSLYYSHLIFKKIKNSFIHIYIHYMGHLSPAPSPPTILTFRQNLFCPLLQFYWKVDISNNKKDLVFLLVEIRIPIWEISSISSMQPELIHLYLTFSLHPGHLPILTSVILRLLY
jgi:hypothetical protein